MMLIFVSLLRGGMHVNIPREHEGKRKEKYFITSISISISISSMPANLCPCLSSPEKKAGEDRDYLFYREGGSKRKNQSPRESFRFDQEKHSID